MVVEDGLGCLVDTQTNQTVLLEDLMKTQVCRYVGGQHVLRTRKDDGTLAEIGVAALLRRFEDGTVSLPFGPSAMQVTLKFYQFAQARCGMRNFFCLTALYGLLGLTSFRGFPSKWSYEGMRSWQVLLGALGFKGEHLMLSTGGLEVEAASASVTRMLPTSACSTLALLALTIRWAYGNAAQSGFRSASAREAASQLVKALLSCCHNDEDEWVLVIVFEKEWVCEWPRVLDHSEEGSLKVSSDGIVDLSAWAELAEEGTLPRHHALRQWWKALSRCGAKDSYTMPFDIFVVMCSKSQALLSLFSQLLWKASRATTTPLAERLHDNQTLAIAVWDRHLCVRMSASVHWSRLFACGYFRTSLQYSETPATFASVRIFPLLVGGALVGGISQSGSVYLLPTPITTRTSRPPHSQSRGFVEHVAILCACLREAALRIDSWLLAENEPQRSPRLDVAVHHMDAMWGSAKLIDYNLARYIEATKHTVGRAPLHVSLATDKAWVKGINLSNTVLVLPTNKAAVLPPQVVLWFNMGSRLASGMWRQDRGLWGWGPFLPLLVYKKRASLVYKLCVRP